MIWRIRSSPRLGSHALEIAPRARLAVAPSPGEWSALETLTHLRDVIVHVYGLRVRRLFYEAAPLFADFDEETYRPASLARGESVEYLLDTFVGEQEQPRACSRRCPTRSGRGGPPGMGSCRSSFWRGGWEHAERNAAKISTAV